jgi:hypothetical protein
MGRSERREAGKQEGWWMRWGNGPVSTVVGQYHPSVVNGGFLGAAEENSGSFTCTSSTAQSKRQNPT